MRLAVALAFVYGLCTHTATLLCMVLTMPGHEDAATAIAETWGAPLVLLLFFFFDGRTLHPVQMLQACVRVVAASA